VAVRITKQDRFKDKAQKMLEIFNEQIFERHYDKESFKRILQQIKN
jgi:hypothetical protein